MTACSINSYSIKNPLFRVSTCSGIFLSALLILFIPKTYAQAYYDSGTFTSTNLLEGKGVKSVDNFGYNASSIPENTTAKVQFSEDNTTWYSSAGVQDAWDTLSQGDHLPVSSSIDLSTLGWTDASFYYKMQFDTTDTSTTPVLDEVVVYFTPGATVSTTNITDIGYYSATASGSIDAISGGNATVRGFRYGLAQEDQFDIHENGSFGAGVFSLSLTNLEPGTTYYVRSYATTPTGTFYGNWTTFTTLSYSETGSLTSTNLLQGYTVTTIDKFNYYLSSKPNDSTASVQFSQDGTTWYNSSGTLDGSNTMNAGNYIIDLSGLGWSGANFYYKVTFGATSDQGASPVLESIGVEINGGEPVSGLVFKGLSIKGIGSCTDSGGCPMGNTWELNETTCNELDGWAWYVTNGREACWSKILAESVAWNSSAKGIQDPGYYTCATEVLSLRERMSAVVNGEWYKIVSSVNSINITPAHNGSAGYSQITALAISDCIDSTRDLCTGDECFGRNDSNLILTALKTWASATGGKSSLPFCDTISCNTSITSDYVNVCEQSINQDLPLYCSENGVFYKNQKVCGDGDANSVWQASAYFGPYSWWWAVATGRTSCSYTESGLWSYTQADYVGFRAVVRP